MDVVLIMVILAGVVVFVTSPLRRAPASGELAEPQELQSAEPAVAELEAARDAKLRELRDAELDHRTGKLSDPDYQALDDTLRAEAIEILRELDAARERISAHHGAASGNGLRPDDGQDRPAADTITD
ncbi:MAG: hypothetical protein ACJ764_13730 [Solirubrobacteraceae bacterium]